MRVKITKSKNAESLYIIKSFRKNGKSTSKIIETLGTIDEVIKKANGADPYEWAKNRAIYLTELEKQEQNEIIVKYRDFKQIPKDKKKNYNLGYLFLQKIYYDLKIDNICEQIFSKYKFEYNFNDILSKLLYSRILFPCSKKSTFEISQNYYEQPKFELHQIYRALEYIYKESDMIQEQLYKNSLKIIKRNDKVLYYDCTNYFFEIESASGIKQYGYSKEHKPNPLVQMGLFMDGNGLPLAFSINPGNTNEQKTLKPLEKKILRDFDLSDFVVCTDAGLSSIENRKFNNFGNRGYITTQSIKKLKKHLKEWALDSRGWKLSDSNRTYTLEEINLNEKQFSNSIFYKERWINEDELSQRIIITYSLKYKKYNEKIRQRQIERAIKDIKNNIKLSKVKNQNDYRRFIKEQHITEYGECAEKSIQDIDFKKIENEAIYDGFYGVCTNLEDDIKSIIKVNIGRWEIEESFRLLKSEFKSRPVNLSKDERIEAHFVTCFIALLIFRILECKMNNKFTANEILKTLREMNAFEITGEGLIPTYTRNNITDELHDIFGFRTDYEINSFKNFKKILKQTKSRKSTTF